MSKYGWERGTITLPAKDWAAFRKGLLTQWNEKVPVKSRVPVTQDVTVNCDEATVTFHNATKSVTWNVPENNHAVETAREHWFAKALFTALGNITWTRGNGGTIVGNDEYNRDSDYEDGGGNYVTAEYSMAAQKRAVKARGHHSSFSNYNYGGNRRFW